MFDKPENLIQLMKDSVSDNIAVANQASADFTAALEVPIRQAIFPGDLYSDLFTIEDRDEYADIRYATDLVQYGREQEFVAYNVPRHGAPPERIVEPDFIRITTSEVFESIEVPIPTMRLGDYNVLKRVVQVLGYGMTMKMNNDAFHALFAAAIGRGFSVVDTVAAPGNFSKALLTAMQVKMRRATGSNASSVNGFKLGRIYVSPEVRASIANFDNTQLDEQTRRSIIQSAEGGVESMFGTEIKDIVELGPTGMYQLYATTVQGFTLTNSKTNLVLGVDLSQRDKFVMPVTQRPVMVDDSVNYRRRNLMSWFVRAAYGVGILDDRGVELAQA